VTKYWWWAIIVAVMWTVASYVDSSQTDLTISNIWLAAGLVIAAVDRRSARERVH